MRRTSSLVSLVLALLLGAAPNAHAARTSSASPSPSPSPSVTSEPTPAGTPSGTPTASPAPKPVSKPVLQPSSSVRPSPAPVGDPLEELDRVRPGGKPFNGPPRERVQDELEAIRLNMLALSKQTAATQRNFFQMQLDLTNAHLRVDGADQALTKARTDLRDNTKNFYMAGAWQDTFVMLNAGNVEDAGRAQVYMETVLDADLGSIARYRDSKARYQKARQLVVAKSAGLMELRTRLTRERTQLDATRRQLQGLLTAVVRTIGSGSSAVSAVVNASQRGQRQAAAAERYVYQPVAGRITSPFGPRIHPIYNYRSNHTGIDIAAPAGTAIIAPRDGVVVAASYAGPFGLATVIDHGSSIATMIAHQATSFVVKGDKVRAGQVIGTVGCTGWCTGPHVHFEVWFAGIPQDPALWMRPYLSGPAVAVR